MSVFRIFLAALDRLALARRYAGLFTLSDAELAGLGLSHDQIKAQFLAETDTLAARPQAKDRALLEGHLPA